MVEITIRDSRVGREIMPDGKGAVLGKTERGRALDIGDTVELADGSQVVVIGDELTIRADGEKQTVFVGSLPARKSITIDAGGCPGWTLQRAQAESTVCVRCLDDDEAAMIGAAASFCRQYGTQPTHRLLSSAYRVWKQTIASLVSPDTNHVVPAMAEDAIGAFVGWLLIWRLIIDQAAHDLSKRFGKESEEFRRFREFKSEIFGGCQGYRVTEALRNMVQHREMPPLSITHSREPDPQSGKPVSRVSLTLPVSWLIDSEKCPAVIKSEFKLTPDALLQVTEVVDDAMDGMGKVIRELIEINLPELSQKITFLRRIFSETAPETPVLLRLSGRPNQGVTVDMQRLDDLTFFIRNAPIGAGA
jgi:hypothetical protein